jgi:hypothetical protein
MLLALVVTLWLATLLISHSLRQQMEATISAQQFSTVSLAAREVDRSVKSAYWRCSRSPISSRTNRSPPPPFSPNCCAAPFC